MPSIPFALSAATATKLGGAQQTLRAHLQLGGVITDIRQTQEQGLPVAIIDVALSPFPIRGVVEIFTGQQAAVDRENELRQAGKVVRLILADAAKVIDHRRKPAHPLVTDQDLLFLVQHDD
jgi:hypothetical protein